MQKVRLRIVSQDVRRSRYSGIRSYVFLESGSLVNAEESVLDIVSSAQSISAAPPASQ